MAHVPTRIRNAVLARDGEDLCVYCQEQGRMEVDHVVPPCDNGPTYPSNLVTACRRCNLRKGTIPAYFFALWLESEGYGSVDSILIRVARHLARPCNVR